MNTRRPSRNKAAKPVGVFDSGVGGLTVVRQIMRRLPNEDIVYFGDTARVPYGTKSPKTILKFSFQNCLFLLKKRVKCIVVACNTSSSIALPMLRKSFNIPIIGVIEPGSRQALCVSKKRRIGIIGTPTTVSSGAYRKHIINISRKECGRGKKRLMLFSQSCPLFVPLAEEGWTNGRITRQVACKYLAPLKKKSIDTLILGCTHYPLLKPVIASVMGKSVTLVDSAAQCALELKSILRNEGLLNRNSPARSHTFYVSDEPEKFAKLGNRFLNRPIRCVRRIEDV